MQGIIATFESRYASEIQNLSGKSGFLNLLRGAALSWAGMIFSYILMGILMIPFTILKIDGLGLILPGIAALGLILFARVKFGAIAAYEIARSKNLIIPEIWGVGGFILGWLVVGAASAFEARPK